MSLFLCEIQTGSACAIQDACRPHAADSIFRFVASWAVRLILRKVGFQRLSIWMRCELMNQLVDYFFACMVFLFNCQSVVVLEFDNRFHRNRSPLCLLEWTLDALSSMLAVSFRPSCQAGSSTTFRSERGDSYILLYSYHHFLNTRCWESVVKDDCVRSCLIEHQSLFPSNSQIGPVHCMLMYFPILIVDCNSGLRHIVIPLLV